MRETFKWFKKDRERIGMETLDELVDSILYGEEEDKRAAIVELINREGIGAVEILRELYKRGGRVAQSISDTLEAIGESSLLHAVTGKEIRKESSPPPLQLTNETMAHALGNLRSKGDRVSKIRTLEALAEMPDDAGLPELLQGLEDPDVEVRRTAAFLLEKTTNPTALPFLLRALKDTDNEVRAHAVFALMNIGSPEALSALRPLERDPDELIRFYAKKAIELLSHK